MDVSRRKGTPYALRDRGVLPVVVEGDESAVRVAYPEQGSANGSTIPAVERRGQGSHDNGCADRSDSANNEPGDENVIATLNKAAGADIQKLMSRGLDGDELWGVEVAAENGGFNSSGSESEGRAVAIIRHY